jgi:hypothetical protein
MYVSTLVDVRSGICNDALPRVGEMPRGGENYAESDVQMSSAKTAASPRHST